MGKEIVNQEVELNFFYMHFRDAQKLHEFSEQEPTKLKSLYARHAIISIVFASEALINRIFNDFYLPDDGKKVIEKSSLLDKWFMAPLLCGKNEPPGIKHSFSKEPFQSFKELIKIRNWLLHPKPGLFMPAFSSGFILDRETNIAIPWVDVLKGDKWPQTKIPLNPFEISSVDSLKAINILDELIKWLLNCFNGTIDENWLFSIDFIDKRDSKIDKLTVDSLWGGYTPSEEI